MMDARTTEPMTFPAKAVAPAKGIATALCFVAAMVFATACPAQKPASGGPVADVALNYAAAHAVHTGTSASFWLQGGSLESNVRFYRGLGLAASVAGFRIFLLNP
jgi:hypothetical protein